MLFMQSDFWGDFGRRGFVPMYFIFISRLLIAMSPSYRQVSITPVKST